MTRPSWPPLEQGLSGGCVGGAGGKPMKKLYEKSELALRSSGLSFIVWLQSVANPINGWLGVESVAMQLLMWCLRWFCCFGSPKTDCKNGMGFAKQPSLPEDFFGTFRWLSLPPIISGMGWRSISPCWMGCAICATCCVLALWRKCCSGDSSFNGHCQRQQEAGGDSFQRYLWIGAFASPGRWQQRGAGSESLPGGWGHCRGVPVCDHL